MRSKDMTEEKQETLDIGDVEVDVVDVVDVGLSTVGCEWGAPSYVVRSGVAFMPDFCLGA